MLTRRPKKSKNSGCAGCTPKVEYYQDYKEEGNGKLSDIYFLVRLINVVFLWFSCREIVELFLRLVVVLIEGNSAFSNLNLI